LFTCLLFEYQTLNFELVDEELGTLNWEYAKGDTSRPLKIADQTAMFFENAFCSSEQSAIGRLGGC